MVERMLYMNRKTETHKVDTRDTHHCFFPIYRQSHNPKHQKMGKAKAKDTKDNA